MDPAVSASTVSTSFEARLFGTLEMRIGDKPIPALRSKREAWLLALLLIRHGHETSREWLATTLWPDNPEEQALFYLRKSLSNLRKALGPEAVRLTSPSSRTLRFDIEGGRLDLAAFDQAIREAQAAEDPRGLLETAVEIYTGPILPDCQEEWAQIERTWREAAYLDALQSLADHSDAATSVKWLRRLIGADPYRESAYRSLMQSLAECGDGAAVTVVFRELGDRLLRDLNAQPSEETTALYRKLSRTSPPAPVLPPEPPKRPETGRHLPVPLSDLIGREEAISDLLNLLQQRRLVTLVGAGGIGKTRLAIATAERALPRFSGGAWFVDLASLTASSQVSTAVARALGVAEENGKSLLDGLMEALANRSILIVLDNCEHLVHQCADLAQNLLSACPDLSLIATSRQALNVFGEQVYRVPSLRLPGNDVSDLSALMKSEAVRLFVDRARRVNHEFHLTPRNASDVVEVCRQLDGIALAIEMAAARLRSLSVSEVRGRLHDRFRLLKSGNRGGLPRQHTLRATIDWSYDQLTDVEREILCSVSVFSGGWTIEAAEAVAGVEITDEPVEDVLASLVDKSLVVAEVREEKTRYRLLETIRQYAHYRLEESERSTLLRSRHRDHFLAFALDLRPKLVTAEQAHWLSLLSAEHDNLRHAINFCLEQPDGGPYGLKFAGALSRFWLIRGHYSEGRATVAAIAAHPAAQERNLDRAVALNGVGLLAWRQSDYEAAGEIYRESLAISREIESQIDVARVLNNLALITRDQGDYDSARTMHEESIAILRECGDRLTTAICLSNLGVVNHYQGDFIAARAVFEEGLAVQRELGDRSAVSVTLRSLGEVALDQGDPELAYRCHEEGLAIATEISDDYGRATHAYGLGRAAGLRGDLAQAWRLTIESFEQMVSMGDRTLVTDHLASLASLSQKLDRSESAITLLAARSNLRDHTGSPLPKYAQQRMQDELTALRLVVGEQAYEQAWREGIAFTMEQAIEYATSLAPPQA